jgi:hypothetical protein
VGIHALGHSIGGQTDAPHGLTMAAVGPAYMRHAWDADVVRYAEVTRILGHARAGESDQELARRSPEALEKFGCRVRMSDSGVKASMIEAMTNSAFKTMIGCLNSSLKSLSRADVIASTRHRCRRGGGGDLPGRRGHRHLQEYPCTYPRPGWIEQDADHLVNATMDAMARAVVQSGVKRLLSTQKREQHFRPTR